MQGIFHNIRWLLLLVLLHIILIIVLRVYRYLICYYWCIVVINICCYCCYDGCWSQSGTDLTGTRIQSSGPVNVYSGNIRALVTLVEDSNVGDIDSGSRDHLVEQILPVSRWGHNYHVEPIPNRIYGKLANCSRLLTMVKSLYTSLRLLISRYEKVVKRKLEFCRLLRAK